MLNLACALGNRWHWVGSGGNVHFGHYPLGTTQFIIYL
jgi:hypothetical protein